MGRYDHWRDRAATHGYCPALIDELIQREEREDEAVRRMLRSPLYRQMIQRRSK